MRIPVFDGKYIISSDSLCYKVSLVTEKNDKDEDVVETEEGVFERVISYPTTISGCIRYIVEREGRVNKCRTLSGYIKHLDEINKKLEETLRIIQKMTGSKERYEFALEKVKNSQLPDLLTLGDESALPKKTKRGRRKK